jgi:hypothetical protein
MVHCRFAYPHVEIWQNCVSVSCSQASSVERHLPPHMGRHIASAASASLWRMYERLANYSPSGKDLARTCYGKTEFSVYDSVLLQILAILESNLRLHEKSYIRLATTFNQRTRGGLLIWHEAVDIFDLCKLCIDLHLVECAVLVETWRDSTCRRHGTLLLKRRRSLLLRAIKHGC